MYLLGDSYLYIGKWWTKKGLFFVPAGSDWTPLCRPDALTLGNLHLRPGRGVAPEIFIHAGANYSSGQLRATQTVGEFLMDLSVTIES